MAGDEFNDFDVDIGTLVEGDVEEALEKEHRAGVRLLVIDPGHVESPIARRLESVGFASSSVETGAQALQAIGAGQFTAIVCVASGDDDWRRFLAAHVRQRYPEFPVLFTAQSAAHSERDRLLAMGATAVLSAPGADLKVFGEELDALLKIEKVQPTAVGRPMEMAHLQKRLRDAEEAGRLKDQEIEQLKQQFLTAIGEAAERSKESTGLRSEVSVLRDRASVMQERLGRARQYIDWLKKENARLADDIGSGPRTTPPVDEADLGQTQLQQLQSLLAALLPFHQSLAQALEFLEELSVVAGKRAPELARHVSQLKLLRDAFQRIRARLGELSQAQRKPQN